MKPVKPKKNAIIQNRCFIEIAMNFIHNILSGKLTGEYVAELAKTPFLHLFCFPKGTHCNNAILHEMMLLWSTADSAFLFRGKKLNFTKEEVCAILCLPNLGKTVTWRRFTYTESMLRHKHFKTIRRISRQQLEEAILKAISDKCPAKEVVGLLVMYLFTTILFPQTGTTVPIHLFNYVEDIDTLYRYNWGEAVYELLMLHIPSCAAWCKLMDNGEEVEEEEKKKKIISLSSDDEEEEKKKKKQKGKKKVEEDDDEEEDEDESGKPSCYLPGCSLALIVSYSKSDFFLL